MLVMTVQRNVMIPEGRIIDMNVERSDENTPLAAKSVTYRYPRSIFLIIATEFCERFSFCGLRSTSLRFVMKFLSWNAIAILSLYLRNVLLFHENGATVVYHVFIMFCYIVPVFGAILADGCLGRFRTILYFSVIYAFGNTLLCFSAIPSVSIMPIVMTYIGLTLIAFGTGGIKPCVAAFGGDQFHLPDQRQRLQQFFSIFYFTINFGGFVGMVLTPILRNALACFGDDTCYALGFGFPTVLMIIALILFLLGKPLYRLKHPKENVMLNFINCTLYALRKRIYTKATGTFNGHWLDYASDKFSPKLISDMKIVLAILFLYLPLPLFWSLFDQQGSRWTFQASKMNGEFLGLQLQPDQIQVINPAIVLLLIPLFEKSIYPCFGKIHVLCFPLQRMIIGGLFAGLAFVISGILELKLEETYPVLLDKGQGTLNVINTLPCDVGFFAPFASGHILRAGEKQVFIVGTHNATEYYIHMVVPTKCHDVTLEKSKLAVSVNVTEYQVDTLILGLTNESLTAILAAADDIQKSVNGRPKVRVLFFRGSENLNDVTIALETGSGLQDVYFVPNKQRLSVSAYMELESGSTSLFLELRANRLRYWARYGNDSHIIHEDLVSLESGGIYALILREYNGEIVFYKIYTMTPPNKIHMFWLIPQYLFISVAEVMFAIAGLEFSFTQAPNSMKTVAIAGWYVSVALGNLIVIIITQARFFKSQAHEFFLFAGLILVDMAVFTLMVRRYSYVVLDKDSSSLLFDDLDERDGSVPGSFVLKTNSDTLPMSSITITTSNDPR